jgi:phage-related protein
MVRSRREHDEAVSGQYRTIFVIDGSTMVLLHGFAKHTQKTSKGDLDLARQRKAAAERAR